MKSKMCERERARERGESGERKRDSARARERRERESERESEREREEREKSERRESERAAGTISCIAYSAIRRAGNQKKTIVASTRKFRRARTHMYNTHTQNWYAHALHNHYRFYVNGTKIVCQRNKDYMSTEQRLCANGTKIICP